MTGTFLKLHHGFLTADDYDDLSNDALLLHIAGCSHASEHLTDGYLPKTGAGRILWTARHIATGTDVAPLIAELLDQGIWTEHPKTFEIVGYLKWNNSRARVDELRDAARDRQRKFRSTKSESPNPAEIDTRQEQESHDQESHVTNSATGVVVELPQPDLKSVPVNEARKAARKAVGR